MILHLIETGGPGGAEQMLLRLADEYGRRGLSQMVCLRKEGWLADEVRQRGLTLKIVPLNRLPDIPWFYTMRKFVKKHNVTAIHSHEFAMNIRGAILGKWFDIPVVATVHGKGYFGDKWMRRSAYRLSSRIANFVAVSEDIRKYLITQCGLNPDHITVIPNGVDMQKFRFSNEKRCAFRDQFGIDDCQVLIGTVGSYYQVKGHTYLIEAMKRLVSVEPNVQLLMAGQGPLGNELRKQTTESGLDRCVHLIDYINDIPGFMSALDIFVLPSLSEGLPLALLEAAANQRCIVATQVGGIPEVIENRKNGILVPPGNSDALAEALIEMLDPSKRLSLVSKAYTEVKRDWSLQWTAERYLKFLDPNSFSQNN
ncbi:MAG: glycosyltransferase [Desulfovermiculus sp.]|nr:glycosyltransferase [Desulfovermiculus sp.]